MKLLITGSRKWRDWSVIEAAILDAKPDVVIHGAAPGADFLAEAICKKHHIDYRGYPAKWNLHRRAAGPIRNQHMLAMEHGCRDCKPDHNGECLNCDEPVWAHIPFPIDLCLAFPMKDSIGTYDMMARAEKAGIKVVVDTRYI